MAKVIASSVRKGNILDIDGKLYVILTADNIHPGKGTPVTQLDLRRISDGVKTQQRYRTTEQVERAYVEDQKFTYLYQDGDAYTFMNGETFDQIPVPTEVIGDYAPYLQENMEVTLVAARGHADLDRDPGARDAGDHGYRTGAQGPDGVGLVQAGDVVEWRALHGAPACRPGHPRGRVDRRWLLRRARQGLSGAVQRPVATGRSRAVVVNGSSRHSNQGFQAATAHMKMTALAVMCATIGSDNRPERYMSRVKIAPESAPANQRS